MTQELSTIREVHLYKLASFCAALDEALRRGGMTPAESLGVWRAAISAECLGCAIQVSGEELQALTQPGSAEAASAKINRLRLGDCARQSCNAYYYRLSFHSHAGVDWPGVLSQVEGVVQELRGATAAQPQWRLPWRGWAGSGLARRLGLALVIVVALLLVRQWHRGGRIPLVREPEHFRVDPAPQE